MSAKISNIDQAICWIIKKYLGSDNSNATNQRICSIIVKAKSKRLISIRLVLCAEGWFYTSSFNGALKNLGENFRAKEYLKFYRW